MLKFWIACTLLSKYLNSDAPKKIYWDLNGDLGLTTIKRWCQMIQRSGSIQPSRPPDGPHIIRTKANIHKSKNLFTPEKQRISSKIIDRA